MYYYLKALHIVFIVTWFAGLFYFPRLLIYNTEAAAGKPEDAAVLNRQFAKMMKPLLYGITWPSAVLTLVLGLSVMLAGGWHKVLLEPVGRWLFIKLFFVAGLYVYHFSLQVLYVQQCKGIFKYSSQQLRVWNEVATIFLVAIVMLAVVKESMSWLWGLVGLVLFIILLMSAIRIYKLMRTRNSQKQKTPS